MQDYLGSMQRDPEKANICERILRAFEQAWSGETPPRLSDYVPLESTLREVVLLELIHTDLELRARAGEQPQVDRYLSEFPELFNRPALLEELRASEQRWRTAEVAKKGQILADRYVLEEEVGRGGFGRVHRAFDRQLQRTVAVKLFHPGQLKTEEERRFLREARSTARLRHSHLVSIHDCGRSDNQLFLVSDFIQGTNLQTCLRDHPPTIRQAVIWLADIAEALEHAHQQGVIHRDVKPSNILIDQHNSVFLVDFGLARCESEESRLTQEGQVLGTPAYMPPEQIIGEAHDADARSDVYALGVILYELLTGEVPFRGHVRMVLRQVLEEEPRPPTRLNDQVPRDLETVCLKAMSKERGHRYARAADFAAELRRYLAGEPVKARPLGPVARTRRWCRRRPLTAGLIVALVVVGLLGATATGLALSRAEQEKKIAQQQALQAEHRLQQGQQLLGAFVQVSRNPLLQQANMQSVRKELLDRVANYYSQFLDPVQTEALQEERHSLSVGALRERALANCVMGETERARSHPREARDYFLRAIELWRQIEVVETLTRSDRIGLAQSHKGLAHSLSGLHQRRDAYQQARKALTHWQQLHEEKATPDIEQHHAETELFVVNMDSTDAEQLGPRWEAARKRLLAYLERDKNNHHLRSILAVSYLIEGSRLAVSGLVSLTPRARQATDEAIRHTRELLLVAPLDPFVHYQLAEAYLLRGHLQARVKENAAPALNEGFHYLESCAPLLEAYRTTTENQLEANMRSLQLNCHLTRHYLGQNQTAKGQVSCRRAMEVLVQLQRDYPQLHDHYSAIIQTLGVAWGCYLTVGDRESAAEIRKHLDKLCMEVKKSLSLDREDHRLTLHAVRDGLLDIAWNQIQKDVEAACWVAERAIAQGQVLVDYQPKDLKAARGLGGCYYHLALLQEKAGQREAAVVSGRQAVRYQQRVVDHDASLDQRKHLDRCHRNLGRTLCGLGRLKEAADCFDARRPLWDKEPERWLLLAREWDALAAAVGKDRATLSPEEVRQKERYLDKARQLRESSLVQRIMP